jgi:transcriptional regulator of acetoin/glycerol metabolism
MPRGRTPLLTAKDIPRVKAALKQEGTIEGAAGALGITTKTLYRFKRKFKLKAIKGVTRIERETAA